MRRQWFAALVEMIPRRPQDSAHMRTSLINGAPATVQLPFSKIATQTDILRHSPD
jgi:hypothetical protein